jgi:beta-galactosidase
MRTKYFCFALLNLLLLFNLQAQPRTILFDSGWKFHRGGAQNAEQPGFDDSSWRKLDLPHDWSIEDLPGTSSPFNRDAISQVSGGFTTGGTGWYRKSFSLPAEQKTKRIIVLFEGVYMNSEIWINGASLGSHPYGYTSFWFDITDKVKFGSVNLLAVKVRNEGENSRWYAGSGIYRHVWLKVLDPVYLSQWGTSISTSEVSATSAKANVRVRISNQSGNESSIRLVTRILNSKGLETNRSESVKILGKNSDSEFGYDVVITNPDLWSTDTPILYTAINEVYAGGNLVDREETKFGIRTISFDAVSGFQLNGKAMKLKGGCYHHDNGPLGSKSFDRAEERKVELLKASGFNAIRCSHNPPAPAFLYACDRLGMLVIDEAFDMWQYPKNPADYNLYFGNWWKKDIESMILRDRNHPSVILWSIGNEIPGMDSPEVVETARLLADFVRKTDPTRMVTAAVNNLNQKKDPYFATLDIAGYNYGSGGDHLKENIFKTDHDRVPSRIMIQTESYPLEAFQSWMDVLDHQWLLGDFVWTAFDYIGEASIGWRGYWQEQSFYPWNLAYCGDIDICGWKRPQSYYRDALWKENQLSIFVKPPEPSFEENPNRMSWSKWHWFDAVADWNWQGNENKALQVSVYSSCDEVELFLNDKSLGKRKTDRSTQYIGVWDVPYQPGMMKAVGYKGKKQVSMASLVTANEVSQIKLTSDRNSIKADGQDLTFVEIDLLDANGIRNPKAENLIRFQLEGPGTIVGVGNANPVSTESYKLPQRKAWQGRCLVIIKSGAEKGEIRLRASAEGLNSSEIKISSVKSNVEK